MKKEIKSIEYYKDLREICGLRQNDLAKLCNVTRQTISAYENGKAKPTKNTLLLIDYVLNEYYIKHKKEIEKTHEHYMNIIKNM